MAGKILAVFIFTLITGMIFGAIIYNHYYQVSERLLEKYDLFFMMFPAIAMFVAGFFVGRAGSGKKKVEYRPMFQGRPQQLGQDGERLIMSALRRVGMVREEGGRK